MSVLKIRQLYKTFYRRGGQVIPGLVDINLSVPQGQVLGIIGSNGAGKSTLLNALTGHIQIDQGSIQLGSHDLTELNEIQRARYISRVFQDPAMGTAPRMTIFENLVLASKRGQARWLTRSLTREMAQEMIQYLKPFRLQMEDRLDVPAESLSGGQRQILSLLMASLKQPDLLLLDEHTAALDPRTGRQVMEASRRMIKEKGITALMITHSLQDALNYCDRLIMMHGGKILADFSRSQMDRMSPGQLYDQMEDLIQGQA